MKNLNILLKHLQAVKTSPWAENYVKEMMKELREIIGYYQNEPYEAYCKKGVPEILKEILGE